MDAEGTITQSGSIPEAFVGMQSDFGNHNAPNPPTTAYLYNYTVIWYNPGYPGNGFDVQDFSKVDNHTTKSLIVPPAHASYQGSFVLPDNIGVLRSIFYTITHSLVRLSPLENGFACHEFRFIYNDVISPVLIQPSSKSGKVSPNTTCHLIALPVPFIEAENGLIFRQFLSYSPFSAYFLHDAKDGSILDIIPHHLTFEPLPSLANTLYNSGSDRSTARPPNYLSARQPEDRRRIDDETYHTETATKTPDSHKWQAGRSPYSFPACPSYQSWS